MKEELVYAREEEEPFAVPAPPPKRWMPPVRVSEPALEPPPKKEYPNLVKRGGRKPLNFRFTVRELAPALGMTEHAVWLAVYRGRLPRRCLEKLGDFVVQILSTTPPARVSYREKRKAQRDEAARKKKEAEAAKSRPRGRLV